MGKYKTVLLQELSGLSQYSLRIEAVTHSDEELYKMLDYALRWKKPENFKQKGKISRKDSLNMKEKEDLCKLIKENTKLKIKPISTTGSKLYIAVAEIMGLQ